ncbi:pyridoxine/pyridoxamine 5'-phosphate oxidase-like isoform X1 [Macrosteles quadrilineatus]|uniref:pyridoxine/pyridoxamine 5'-phosphate oxidase-like isoform X1 n=1 Tax=Macrosteles quadrilineatus TaxID=74068 RepID=UPI0023E172D4|nr:pyridoxine/pyridoxamine 5'-phosphate oxidase-like isoform X1 [Macrosteles quadrilineatus]
MSRLVPFRHISSNFCQTNFQFSRFLSSINMGSENEINIQGMRTKYHGKENTFLETDLQSIDPINQFKIWFDEAAKTPGIAEANSMCLATASKDGKPSARFLLLKGFGTEGFKFYTNYNSRKAHDLEENPNAAITFYWEPLHRSVRIEGKVRRVPEADSDQYFHSRPRASQIGTACSNQSSVIESRATLTEKEAELEQLYANKEVPRPPHWGGYILEPETIEFWQGQSNRIHDRIRFRRCKSGEKADGRLTHVGENGWVYERLAP